MLFKIFGLQFSWKKSDGKRKFSYQLLEKFQYNYSKIMNTNQNQIKIDGIVLAIDIVMSKINNNSKKSFSYSKELLKSLFTDKTLVKYNHQIQDCDVVFIHLIPIRELNCIAIFLNFIGFSIILCNFQFCTIIRLVSYKKGGSKPLQKNLLLYMVYSSYVSMVCQ